MDQTAILREYQLIRRCGIELNKKLVKRLSPETIDRAGLALGLKQGKKMVFDSEDEVAVLFDYAIHNVSNDGKNAIERYLEEEPPAQGTLEWKLLHSFRDSHYTVIKVESAIPGFGLRAVDQLKQTSMVLIDVGLSSTAVPGLLLASRIHSPDGQWWMTTGAGLPMNAKASARLEKELQKHQRLYASDPTNHEFTTTIIRTCLASGASEEIAYADAEDLPPPRLRRESTTRALPIERTEPKVGRNDPCPCGSGRKYKKCCGA